MNPMGNEWALLERYEAWERSCPAALRDYARHFKVELVEILAQIEGPYPLAGYKLHTQVTAWEKWKWILRKLFAWPAPSERVEWQALAKNAPLVFVVEYAGHFKQLAPVAALLRRQQVLFQVVFLRPDLFLQHHTEFDHAVLLTSGNMLRPWLKCLKIIVLLWKNKGFSALVKPVKRTAWRLEATLLNARFLRETESQREALSTLLRFMPRAKVVFFKSEGCKVKTLISACKAEGRKVVALQHGLIGREMKYADLPVDLYLTWSAHFSKALSMSRANCKTLATGCPNYDSFFQLRPQNPGIPEPHCLKLLFLPNSGNAQTPRSELEFALGLCLALLRNHAHISLTIKPHPSDHSSLLEDMVRASSLGSRVRLLPRNAEIPYAGCDLVATMNSTTGLEAAIFGKPLLVLLSDPAYVMVDEYLSAGAGIWANSLPSLEAAVSNILAHYPDFQARANSLLQKLLCNQGNAANTVCDYLLRA